MNRHFSDARYYLGRAVEHAKAGLLEEFDGVERRVREREAKSEQFGRIRTELRNIESRVEGEGRKVVRRAQQRLR